MRMETMLLFVIAYYMFWLLFPSYLLLLGRTLLVKKIFGNFDDSKQTINDLCAVCAANKEPNTVTKAMSETCSLRCKVEPSTAPVAPPPDVSKMSMAEMKKCFSSRM